MGAQVMDFDIRDVTLEEAVDDLLSLMGGGGSHHVSFVNAHYANVAHADPRYGDALRAADLLFADGSGMRLAGRLAGVHLKDNVNGTDLFPPLARAMGRRGMTIFLLGGAPGVAEKVGEWVERSAPGLRVVGVRNGYWSAVEEDDVAAEIEAARPDLLLVGLGAPAQDVWIRRHLQRTRVPVAMAVGGLFDFFSGRIPRAPGWMRALGIEWTYRLIQEPSRMWRRYLIGNITFMARAARASAGRWA
jgi:N-acetylglucosaminyldiphosphoundecaprenol N-acetyl-beta-D-mannosaminyltransferase